jgi:hypothetical protein
MKRRLLRTLSTEGFDAFAREAAAYKTQVVHGDYNISERSFAEQSLPKFARRLTTYPGLVARRIGRPVLRLLNPKTPMPKRIAAANDILQLLIKTTLMGYIFAPLGTYDNPYSFKNIAVVPGTISGDFINNVSDTISAVVNNEYAKAATLVDNMSSQMMPTKKMLWRIIDEGAGQKNYMKKFFTGKLDTQRLSQYRKDEIVLEDVLDYYVYFTGGPNALKRSKENRDK